MSDSTVASVPGTLGELLGKDLSGWQIGQAHFLELKHGLMGMFPAILNDEDAESDGEIVLVLDKRLLALVWEHIEHAHAKVSTSLVVANPELGLAFSLERPDPATTKPLRLFSAGELAKLCETVKPFRWAPGLFGALNPTATPPKFE